MPVADTEFLFALHPADPHHRAARGLLDTGALPGLRIPSVALWEFLAVMLSRGDSAREIAGALRSIEKIRDAYRIPILDLAIPQLTRGLGLMETHRLSFFDALIAGAALEHDGRVVGNDPGFDRVEGLKRTPL